jgi:phage terminase large subunit GpA-like protein
MTAVMMTTQLAASTEWAWAVAQCRAPRLRTMREFAEQELVLPDGPFAGLRFNCARQPYAGLWLDEVASGRYSEIVSTGPSQSGKSLLCFVLPTIYHLFEMREAVICGLPTMDMADEKWEVDIEPAIRASRFDVLLPRTGPGSRGGSDKSRAGSTARVIVITETDGLDESGTTSREASKIQQIEARARAFGERRLVYKECTVSIAKGHTWTRYHAGTASRIVTRCPHCQAWTTPEREHLVAWRECETELAARAAARFCCPACGHALCDDERREALAGCRLVHRGQEIDADGQVAGEPPPTKTFGFRWSAYQNLFASAGQLGAEEWRGSRSANSENAEKELRQFVWCLPYDPPTYEDTPLDFDAVRRRFLTTAPKGLIPAWSRWQTIGLDLGKRVGHWVLVAWREDATGHVVDYGTIDIASDSLGVERAMLYALRDFADRVAGGWVHEAHEGTRRETPTRVPDQVWIDAGYRPDIVQQFVRERGEKRYRPVLGRGLSQRERGVYYRPKKTGNEVKYLGEEYHISWIARAGIFQAETNADYWKTFVREGLAMPLDAPGAITLYHASSTEHISFVKHLTAEEPVTEFVEGRGETTRWERRSRSNHYLDALYNACVAGHLCGARRAERKRPAAPPPRIEPASPLTTPDGRPFLVSER